MPAMPHDSDGTVPTSRERPFDSRESDCFSSLGRIDLDSIGVESADRLAGKLDRNCWSHELADELIVPPKPEVQLLAKLADKHGRAPLQGQVERATIHGAHPHAAAQLIVVGQSKACDATRASSQRYMKGDRVPRTSRRKPHRLVGLRLGKMTHPTA